MQIEKTDLLKALNVARPAISTKASIAQTDHFLLDAGRVKACDDFLAIIAPLPVPWDGEPLAVIAAPLLELLGRMPDGPVTVEYAENELRVKSGRVRAGIAARTEIQLAVPVPPKKSARAELPEGFGVALKGASFCVSKSTADPRLASMRCEGAKVLCGDNFRFAEFNLPSKFAEPFSLPSNFLKPVLDAVPTHYAIADGWLWFFGEYTIGVRAWTQDYPTKDIMQFFEVVGESVELPKDLAAIVERAGVLAGDDLAQDKLVELSFSGGKLTVRGQGARGWVEERVRVNWDGERSLMIAPSVLSEATGLSSTMVMGERTALFTGEGWRHIVALEESK